MQRYIERVLSDRIKRRLTNTPAVAVLGPRQCGKSTLAKMIISDYENSVYLDLEKPSHLNRLSDPEAFFELNAGKLVCLDEIQRAPDLFLVMRSVIDENAKNGQFLILGSASPDLIKQSSETLAGRIAYYELTPFLLSEVSTGCNEKIFWDILLRGGFHRSYLSRDDTESFEWRQDFIRTFLERDIPQLGIHIPAKILERFWKMCAHLHGQLLNSSKLGESLGVSHHTVRTYVDLLEKIFIIRVLYPLETNLKKRLVKSPKVYIRDTGLLHALLDIENHNDLLGHPVFGSSWEGFVIENIASLLPNCRSSFYRTSSGSEIDLVLEKGQHRIAIECKAATSPKITEGFRNALEDLGIDEAWIIAPVKEAYQIKKAITVAPLLYFIKTFSS